MQSGQVIVSGKDMLMGPQVGVAVTDIIYQQGSVIDSLDNGVINFRLLSVDERVLPQINFVPVEQIGQE